MKNKRIEIIKAMIITLSLLTPEGSRSANRISIASMVDPVSPREESTTSMKNSESRATTPSDSVRELLSQLGYLKKRYGKAVRFCTYTLLR